MLRAIACRYVDIIGHPTGRRLLRREGYKVDVNKLIDAAVTAGVVLEINAQVDRLDLSDIHAKAARDRGVEDRDQHRLARQRRISAHEVGRPGGPPRMADERGCAEYEDRWRNSERA